MGAVGLILQIVGGIAVLVCFIMVEIKMFQNGKTGLGIVCIVLYCCAIGMLINFIYGWMKSAEWNIRNVMLVYTVGLIIAIIGGVMNPQQYNVQQIQHGAIPVSTRPAF